MGISLKAVAVPTNRTKINYLCWLFHLVLSFKNRLFWIPNWFSHACHIANPTCFIFAFAWMVTYIHCRKYSRWSSMISAEHVKIYFSRCVFCHKPTTTPTFCWMTGWIAPQMINNWQIFIYLVFYLIHQMNKHCKMTNNFSKKCAAKRK